MISITVSLMTYNTYVKYFTLYYPSWGWVMNQAQYNGVWAILLGIALWGLAGI
ncbi:MULTISPECIES: hypothetical protein [Sphingobacterium]|uniref:Uncharacterized protein n=1 Tax=Sphingobacterium populi TaxID=1812824 RepID=A0ABW5U7Y9_9SPHI|nr:hypothetical protein [Sphingobacterium sp. CFCC 11742]